jgi:hypothetical protein
MTGTFRKTADTYSQGARTMPRESYTSRAEDVQVVVWMAVEAE